MLCVIWFARFWYQWINCWIKCVPLAFWFCSLTGESTAACTARKPAASRRCRWAPAAGTKHGDWHWHWQQLLLPGSAARSVSRDWPNRCHPSRVVQRCPAVPAADVEHDVVAAHLHSQWPRAQLELHPSAEQWGLWQPALSLACWHTPSEICGAVGRHPCSCVSPQISFGSHLIACPSK